MESGSDLELDDEAGRFAEEDHQWATIRDLQADGAAVHNRGGRDDKEMFGRTRIETPWVRSSDAVMGAGDVVRTVHYLPRTIPRRPYLRRVEQGQ